MFKQRNYQNTNFSTAETRRVAIFGVTGSIGQSTVRSLLEYQNIRKNQGSEKGNCINMPELSVEVITGGSNVELLAEYAIKLSAKRVVICDETKYSVLKNLLATTNIDILCGTKAITEVASTPLDWAMMAISGIAALSPMIKLAQQGATIALANKEGLVAAGAEFVKECEKNSAILLPVDSEHNTIFQLLDDRQINPSRIWLTASGGALRDWPIEKLVTAKPSDALSHPNWSMGTKITIDSATMMNKAFEVIEAMYLFDYSIERVGVVIHKQSIAHGFIELPDGTLMGAFSRPLMENPIRFALYWPHTSPPFLDQPKNDSASDFCALGSMEFAMPDLNRYPALEIGKIAATAGGFAPCILNSANDAAVDKFLNNTCKFTDITRYCSAALEKFMYQTQPNNTNTIEVDNLLEIDTMVRDWVLSTDCSQL